MFLKGTPNYLSTHIIIIISKASYNRQDKVKVGQQMPEKALLLPLLVVPYVSSAVTFVSDSF